MQHELTPVIYLSQHVDPAIPRTMAQMGSQFQLYHFSRLQDIDGLLAEQPICILLIDETYLSPLQQQLSKIPIDGDRCSIIVISQNGSAMMEKTADEAQLPINQMLSYPLQLKALSLALMNARQFLLTKTELNRLKQTLQLQNQELRELYDIGIALSAERDYDTLLQMILLRSRQITHADAGSLYLVEPRPDIAEDESDFFANKQLRFKLAHNDSVKISFQETVMPIEKKSVAGFVALSGQYLNIPDVYDLSQHSKFKHNRSFDEAIGYRTKSMLVIPMKNHKDEIIGVLQLINRKQNRDARLTSPEIVEQEVIPFDDKCVDLASSLASQAAVSIENNRLYEEIKRLFEGFIRASVHAIEQRDPTTSGHSERVAVLTTALAEKVDRIDHGPFKDVTFTRNQIQQIKYASLLHDFGKIGVREHVLVKAKKLFPHELEAVKNRFRIVKQATQLNYSYEKINSLLQLKREVALAQLLAWDEAAKQKLRELDNYLNLIYELNEPSVMRKTGFEILSQIGQIMFEDDGINETLLSPREIEALSIPRGSLSEEERKEIESHVNHTFNFLSKIPWTSELKRVPQIAHAHHEKLDGSGYPQKLSGDKIPLESRMMAIADIFDALTAWDRPYKKAVPVEKALEILQWEVNDGKLDGDLLQIFLDARLFELVKKAAD